MRHNRRNISNRAKVIAKRIDTFPFTSSFNAILSIDSVAKANSNRAIERAGASQSRSVEKIMKTTHKIAIVPEVAIVPAIAFSAFAFTATAGLAARLRSVAPRKQYWLSYSQGGMDCSFTSYAQCEATA
jgi:hypothetical protein